MYIDMGVTITEPSCSSLLELLLVYLFILWYLVALAIFLHFGCDVIAELLEYKKEQCPYLNTFDIRPYLLTVWYICSYFELMF